MGPPTYGGTFQPLQHRSGTLRDRLHSYTKSTLGAGGSISEAVRICACPQTKQNKNNAGSRRFSQWRWIHSHSRKTAFCIHLCRSLCLPENRVPHG